MAQRVYTQTFGVVGAILERGGKILLVREGFGKAKGLWNHPAGWLEVGEHPVEGVKKEVKEETGFDFEPTHVLGIYSLIKAKGKEKSHHGIKMIFLGKIGAKQEKFNAKEILQTKWFSPAEIDKMDETVLRDFDIKTMVKDNFLGKKYPLDLLTHTVQE